MLRELEQPCQITIKDTGGSNVDLSSVEVRYSTEGEGGYTDWTTSGISSSKKGSSYVFLTYLRFNYGDANLVQWRASDNAGNGPYESDEYSLLINSPPFARITNPKSTSSYFEGKLITFDAKSSDDPDFGDVLSYYWHSNVSGSIGYKDYFRTTLVPGQHMITLWVIDEYNHNVSKIVNITVKYSDLDNDGIPDKDDPDDDNDGYLDSEDAFPNDKDEWLDTDFDGKGNRADPDDDNDGHPDSEDEYPLDKDRWQKEEESTNEGLVLPLIVLVIVIIIVVLVLFAYLRSKKKKAQSQGKGKEEEGAGTGARSVVAPPITTTTTTTTPTTIPSVPSMAPAPTQTMYMQMPPVSGQQMNIPMLPPQTQMPTTPISMPMQPPMHIPMAPMPMQQPMQQPMQPQPQQQPPMQTQPQHQPPVPPPVQLPQQQQEMKRPIPQAPVGEVVEINTNTQSEEK